MRREPWHNNRSEPLGEEVKTTSAPAEIADALGIPEDDYIIEVEEGNVVMKPAVNPFEYALKVKNSPVRPRGVRKEV